MRRSLQASIEYDGRPRFNNISNNNISHPGEKGKAIAITGSDNDYILNNVFVNISILRFDNSSNTLVKGNVLPDGVTFTLEDGASLAKGSQNDTQV